MTGICTCTGKITDPERAARFAGIFPNDEIPIRYPILAGAGRVERNGRQETFEFYEVAIERFTEEQKQRVAVAVSKAGFPHLTVDEVLRDMGNAKMIIPLRADGVIVSWCELHVRCAL